MQRLWCLILASILLVSCAKKSETLPPEEVLQRSAQEHQSLQSADIDMEIRFFSEDAADWTAGVRGRLQDGGRQFALEIGLTGATLPLSGDLRVVVAEANETYFSIERLGEELDIPEGFLGKWWLVPSRTPSISPETVAPSPTILRTQAEAVRVMDDHGIETEDGRSVYHYTVTIDPDRFLSLLRKVSEESGTPFDPAAPTAFLQTWTFTGDLWIDAEKFYLRKAYWTVQHTERPLQMTVAVNIRNHDQALPVLPPDNAEMFSIEKILDMKGKDAVPETEQQLLKMLFPE